MVLITSAACSKGNGTSVAGSASSAGWPTMPCGSKDWDKCYPDKMTVYVSLAPDRFKTEPILALTDFCKEGDGDACSYLGGILADSEDGASLRSIWGIKAADHDADKSFAALEKGCEFGSMTSCMSLSSQLSDRLSAGPDEKVKEYFLRMYEIDSNACEAGFITSCDLMTISAETLMLTGWVERSRLTESLKAACDHNYEPACKLNESFELLGDFE